MRILPFIALLWVNFIIAQSKPISLIESLGPKDTLKIMFSRNHCVNPIGNKMRFYFNEEKGGKLVAEKKDKMGVLIEISPAAKEFLIRFEEEGRAVSDPEKVCTASDGYWFYINDDFKLLVVDNSCSWLGYEKLIKEVFDE